MCDPLYVAYVSPPSSCHPGSKVTCSWTDWMSKCSYKILMTDDPTTNECVKGRFPFTEAYGSCETSGPGPARQEEDRASGQARASGWKLCKARGRHGWLILLVAPRMDKCLGKHATSELHPQTPFYIFFQKLHLLIGLFVCLLWYNSMHASYYCGI